MANVKDAARLLIQLGTMQAEADSGDGMTNLRLNKLLYFAQGYSLSKYGVPLFSDQIEAWDFGPVVPSVYRMYRKYGRNILSDVEPSRESFSDTDFTVLFDTFNAAKAISTNELVNISHRNGSPWKDVYDQEMNGVISTESMRSYFTEHPFCQKSFQDAIAKLKEKAYTPMRDENGVAVIPKEIADGWE